ncbi:MAG: hypothetical protein PVSMB8_00260 [Vulcanimicrobiaceae bacterium]
MGTEYLKAYMIARDVPEHELREKLHAAIEATEFACDAMRNALDPECPSNYRNYDAEELAAACASDLKDLREARDEYEGERDAAVEQVETLEARVLHLEQRVDESWAEVVAETWEVAGYLVAWGEAMHKSLTLAGALGWTTAPVRQRRKRGDLLKK